MDLTKFNHVIILLDFLALVQGIIIGVILLFRSKEKKPTLLLGFYIITFSLNLTNSILEDLEVFEQNPQFMFLPIDFTYLSTPLLFLYVKKITKGIITRKEYFLSLTPGVIEFIIFSVIFFLPLNVKVDIDNADNIIGLIISGTYIFTAPVYIVYYLILILKYVKRNKIKVLNYFSNIDGKLLRWAKGTVYFLLLHYFLIVLLVILTIMIEQLKEARLFFDLFSTLLNMGFIYWLGICGLTQSTIFNIKKDTGLINSILNDGKDVLFLPEEEISREFKKIVKKVDEDELYKNPITLSALAKEVRMPSRTVSSLIHANTNQNFSQFINYYRVEEVKRMLKDKEYDKLDLLALAYEVGFSSKASFFSVFKKNTGMTPNSFRNNIWGN